MRVEAAMRSLAPVLLASALLVAFPPLARAAWLDWTDANLAVCRVAGDQISQACVSDGAGGLIVVWTDAQGSGSAIFAQHVLTSGALDPAWPPDGRLLSTAAGGQINPSLMADASGGAIVTWMDYRSGTTHDIYAQRVSAGGTTLWTAGGVALCTAPNYQYNPKLVTDGAGGAIVAWHDTRSGTTDIYAQRISAVGVPQWTLDGVAVCTASNSQAEPTLVSDGAGGAIVTWHDARPASHYDIYAQRINASGAPQWAVNGVAICAAPGTQSTPTIAGDGAGGAIVAWYDYRGPTVDIFAQRVNHNGTVQWAADGVALCTAGGDQLEPEIISDGAGGAITAWVDQRRGPYDIYAQRLNSAGIPQWTLDGMSICTAANNQQAPALVADDAGGVIVAWHDARGTENDIFAQRISAAGQPLWAFDGVALTTHSGNQLYPAIASDGAGGAITVWQDFRGGISYDIYAQRVLGDGSLGISVAPAIAGALDTPNDQGGTLKLMWDASPLDADPYRAIVDYRVWRSVPPQVAREALGAGARLIGAGEELQPGPEPSFRTTSTAVGTIYWEYLSTHVARRFAGYSTVVHTLSDSVPGSNPFTLFLVEARCTDGVTSWDSAPDSGYSVDNLSPATPAPFTGSYSAGTSSLHWGRNYEADLVGYKVYRGSSTTFTPGPDNLVVTLADTGFVDVPGAPFVYKLTAVDLHGNESQVATVVPSGALGVSETQLVVSPTFAAPQPNPAFRSTLLRYSLSQTGYVRLSVYDAAGRRVNVLHDGELAAGPHSLTFTLTDGDGRALANGLYVLRLEAEGRVLTRRLVAIR